MSTYKTIVALSIKGDRVEPNTEVELTYNEVSRFDTNDISLVAETTEIETPAEPEPPVEKMNLEQLKSKAKALGLPATGSKADILERISLAVTS